MSLGNFFECLHYFHGKLRRPGKLPRQHVFYFIQDKWRCDIANKVFSRHLRDILGSAAKIEGRDDNVCINDHS